MWITLGGGYCDRTVSLIIPDQSPTGMEEASDNWKDHASVLREGCSLTDSGHSMTGHHLLP